TISNAKIDNNCINFTIPKNIEAGTVVATFKYAHMADVTLQLFVSGADAKQFHFEDAQLIFTAAPTADSAPTDTDLYDIHIFVRVLESGTDKALFSRVFSAQFNFEAKDATQEQIIATQPAPQAATNIDKAAIATQASQPEKVNINKEKAQPVSSNLETVHRVQSINTIRSTAAPIYLWIIIVDKKLGQIIYTKITAVDTDVLAPAIDESTSDAILISKPTTQIQQDLPDSATETTAAPSVSYTVSTKNPLTYIPHVIHSDTNQEGIQAEQADNQPIPIWSGIDEQNLFEITGSFRAYEDDPAQNPTGKIKLIDPNQGDYLLVVNDVLVVKDSTIIETEYGILHVNLDGTWEYVLDNNLPAVEALNGQTSTKGETLTEHVRVTYADSKGNIQEKAEIVFDITIGGRTDYYGSSTNDIITGRSSDDALFGLDGDDTLDGGGGSDVLDGGAGLNFLRGDSLSVAIDRSKDIFVLNLQETPNLSLAIVADFVPGEDKIRIDTPTGTESTLEELKTSTNIYWQTKHIETPSTTNDPDIEDTVIYDSRGTQDIADDIVLMVLEDLLEPLTIDDFDIV
ncbi:MAG: VCBS domain-containing protein, partial [Alphaproteobacteria bacterium]|nr:VCBS domain-containing protein [Alphaproteobacteria bacterium]